METAAGRRLARIFETGDGPGRILSMEGLRGFAVLLIFGAHYHSMFSPYLAPDSWMFRLSEGAQIIGQSGVDLFFILSGYLIYGRLLRKPGNYGRFARRRIQRIYPAFAAMLALYVFLHFTVFPIQHIPSEPMAAAVFVFESAALLPGLFEIPPVITVAWSLSYEMFFYATIPVVVALTSMRNWRTGARSLFFLGVAAGYAVFHLAAAEWSIAPLRLLPAGHPRMLMFIAGILIYEFRTSPLSAKLTARGEVAAAALLAAGYAGNWLLAKHAWMVDHLPTSMCRVAVLIPGLSALALYSFAFSGVLQRIFSRTPLRWLGNMSYSYYLAHTLALHGLLLAANRVFPPDEGSPVFFAALLPAALLLSLAPATALFLGVEKPFSLTPPTRQTMR